MILNAACAQARALAMPAFTVITLSHPVQNLTPEEVRQRADSVIEAVVRKWGDRARAQCGAPSRLPRMIADSRVLRTWHSHMRPVEGRCSNGGSIQ